MSTTARHPTACTEHGSTGGQVRAWYVPGNPYDDTDTTHGTIQGTRQNAGDAAQSDPFTFEYWDSGSSSLKDMIVQDDVFGISPAYEGQARLNLVVMLKGDGAVSNWHSSDGGRTWTLVAGTGGGEEGTPMSGMDDGPF